MSISDGSRFSESILERWRSAIASQQNVTVLEFWSPCLPQFFHELIHCRCWASRSHDVLQERLVLQCCVYQVVLIDHEFAQLWHSCFLSDRHVWTPITLCVTSGRPDLSEEQSSSWNDFTLISWERDVSPLTTNTSCVLSSCPDLSQIGFGLVGRILLVWQLLLVTVEQLLLLVVDQL